jgi:hypothetical protein
VAAAFTQAVLTSRVAPFEVVADIAVAAAGLDRESRLA